MLSTDSFGTVIGWGTGYTQSAIGLTHRARQPYILIFTLTINLESPVNLIPCIWTYLWTVWVRQMEEGREGYFHELYEICVTTKFDTFGRGFNSLKTDCNVFKFKWSENILNLIGSSILYFRLLQQWVLTVQSGSLKRSNLAFCTVRTDFWVPAFFHTRLPVSNKGVILDSLRYRIVQSF